MCQSRSAEESMSGTGTKPWWPFTTNEAQLAMGVYGCVWTILALTGLDSELLVWGACGSALVLYLAGLLVHAQRAAGHLKLIRGGALSGHGHISLFRETRRCLFLMHLDDDPPSEELLALYRRLLKQGVRIRRVIFLRENAAPSAYSWIVEFGEHEGLQQRVVLPEQAEAIHFSFVVVDDAAVALSVPGWEPIDGAPYTAELLLRHLLIMRDADVVSTFLRVHEETWDRALPLESPEELSNPEALARRCAAKGAA